MSLLGEMKTLPEKRETPKKQTVVHMGALLYSLDLKVYVFT